MKQRIPAMALVLATTVTLVAATSNLTPGASPYGAAEPASQSTSENKTEPAVTPETTTENTAESTAQETKPFDDSATELPASGALKISFDNVESYMRENNPTIRANKESLKGVKDAVDAGFFNQYISLNMQMSSLRSQLTALQGQLASAPDNLKSYIQAQIDSLQRSIAALEMQSGAVNDAEDDDDSYDRAKRQFAAADDQICMGAQTYYLSILSLEASKRDVDRSLAALDRSVKVLEKQYAIGQCSEMDLLGVKQKRTSLKSTADTLSLNLKNLKQDLALMLSGSAKSSVQLVALPNLTDYQLSKLHYQNDLADAKKNSFTLWQKQIAIYDASDADNDGQLAAAKINRDAAAESLEVSFRKLYDAIGEKKRLLAVASDASDYQEKEFAVSKRKHELGMISDNEMKDAEDSLTAAQSAVSAARIDLYTAYNQYQWAVRGMMN